MIGKGRGFCRSNHKRRLLGASCYGVKAALLLSVLLLILLLTDLFAGSTHAIGAVQYQKAPLIVATASAASDHLHYLPLVYHTEILSIADFNRCGPPNNLGGDMGAACPQAGCQPPNSLAESYVVVGQDNCAVHLEYHIQEWAAFWLQLLHADLSPYSTLAFDLKADAAIGVPNRIRIELKRDCHQTGGGTDCREISIKYVENIDVNWQRTNFLLADFQETGWPGYQGIQDWSDIEELVFTFEADESGQDGAVLLDNLYLSSND